MSAVRPVVAEETAAAEFIVGDDQAVGGDAFVGDFISMSAAGDARGMHDQLLGVLGEMDGFAAFFDGADRHAFPIAVLCREIERKFGGVFPESKGYGSGAG